MIVQHHSSTPADPAYGRDMTEPDQHPEEPAARTAGEQDHEDVDALRGEDAHAPQNPETDPQSS